MYRRALRTIRSFAARIKNEKKREMKKKRRKRNRHMLDTTRSVIWKTVIWANLFPLQFTRTAGFILYVVREKWKKKVESKKQRKIIWVTKSEGGGDSRRLTGRFLSEKIRRIYVWLPVYSLEHVETGLDGRDSGEWTAAATASKNLTKKRVV